MEMATAQATLITSIGQSDTENSNIARGPITKQMERYYADLVLINKAVIENADITSANIESLKAHQAYIDQLKASFKMNLDSISTSLLSVQQNLKDNYSTTTVMKNAITLVVTHLL